MFPFRRTDVWPESTHNSLLRVDLSFAAQSRKKQMESIDAVYPPCEGQGIHREITGAKKYVLHFDKGQLPPVDGFWSLTMYDAGYFFVPNPLNRYTVSQRNKFAVNADGSVELYVQNESPARPRSRTGYRRPRTSSS
jgi:hypothetical protein